MYQLIQNFTWYSVPADHTEGEENSVFIMSGIFSWTETIQTESLSLSWKGEFENVNQRIWSIILEGLENIYSK